VILRLAVISVFSIENEKMALFGRGIALGGDPPSREALKRRRMTRLRASAKAHNFD
jgi:hypothetical protein